MAYPAAFTNIQNYSLVFLFSICFCSLHAQLKPNEITQHSKSVSALKAKGNKALKDEDFLLAQVYYETLLAKRPDNATFQNTLAKIYLKNRLYAQAENLFAKSVTYEPSTTLYLAYSQLLQAKYNDAQLHYTSFKKDKKYKKNEEESRINAAVQLILKQRLDKQIDTIKPPMVMRLNKKVNGKLSEFSPLLLNDSTLLFGKTTPDETLFYLKSDSVKTDIPYRRYFTGKIDSSFDVQKITQWKFSGFSSEKDFGGACFSADGKTMYLTICDRKSNTLECHLYSSKKNTQGWGYPQLLEGKINEPGYSSAQPTLGYDAEKKADVLYFSSNKPGAKGFDIYYAVYDKAKGQFTGVSKCGPKVNSIGNEYTPFYVLKDSTLFFSSDGKGGFGGLDILKVKGKLNIWTDPVALSAPINSAADDAYYSQDVKGKNGFFTSNRNSESASEIKTCCEDIYAFTFNYTPKKDTPTIVNVLKVNVPIKVEFSNTDTSSAPVYLTVATLENGVKKIVFESTLRSRDTTFNLNSNKVFSVSVGKDNYLTETAEIDLNGIRTNKHDTILLTPKIIPQKPIIIPGINYEFDSDLLTEASIKIIDDFIYPILNDNPSIVFQINSHTDSKGDDDYNQKLSERRAQSVVNYLTLIKGIPAQRLKSKGFGETKPIAPNENADGSDNTEGRAQNRRTEFEVIGKLR